MKTNMLKSQSSMFDLEALQSQMISRTQCAALKGGSTDGDGGDSIIIVEDLIDG